MKAKRLKIRQRIAASILLVLLLSAYGEHVYFHVLGDHIHTEAMQDADDCPICHLSTHGFLVPKPIEFAPIAEQETFEYAELIENQCEISLDRESSRAPPSRHFFIG